MLVPNLFVSKPCMPISLMFCLLPSTLYWYVTCLACLLTQTQMFIKKISSLAKSPSVADTHVVCDKHYGLPTLIQKISQVACKLEVIW